MSRTTCLHALPKFEVQYVRKSVRQRVQQESTVRRGRTHGPIYRIRGRP